MPIEMLDERDPAATRAVLESLPEWFGAPEAVTNYVDAAASPQFRSLVARDHGRAVGITLVSRHFPEAAEIHLIAVSREHRGRGVGRAMVERVAEELTADGCRLLSVHTVGPSHNDDHYAATRTFYRSVGFLPLQELQQIDWDGPTLILVRTLC